MELNEYQKIMFLDIIRAIPGGKDLSEKEEIRIMEPIHFLEFWDGKAYSMEGTVSGGLSFLNTGMFKITNVKTKSCTEKLRDLNFPGYNIMVGNIDSLFSRTPAHTSIHSVGNSTSFGFGYTDIMNLKKDIPCFGGIIFQMIINSLMAHPNLIRSFEGLDKMEKRIQFNMMYPDIAKELTLIQLASLFELSKTTYKK
jgi:hypothetical protein